MDAKRFLIRWAAQDLATLEGALAVAGDDDRERLSEMVAAARTYLAGLWRL